MAVNFFMNALNTDARHATFTEIQGDQHNIIESKPNHVSINKPHRKIGKHLTPTKGAGSSTNAIVFVMGTSGAGKSTFINMVTGTSELSIGDGLRSCTGDVQMSEFVNGSGRRVRLIDTPGFDHTEKSDIDVLNAIANCLSDIYRKGELLAGVVYMTQEKAFMGRSTRRTFNVIRKLCGNNALSNVAIVMNHIDQVSSCKEIEAKPSKCDLFQSVTDKHGKLYHHYNNRDFARSIIDSLMKGEPKSLQIQHELVDKHMNLYQTEAGMELTHEMRRQLQTDNDLFNSIMGEMRA